MDYRQRIYEKYASVCKARGAVFDENEAVRYAQRFSRRLDGWLPSQKDAEVLDLAYGSGRTLYLLKAAGYANILGVRTVLGALLRRVVVVHNMVKMGHRGSGICTHDFFILAVKPTEAKGS